MRKREGMVVRSGREMAPLSGEVVGSAVARPVEAWPARPQQPVVIHMHAPARAVEEPVRSKAPAWGVLALALVIALFACYAAISSMSGPQLQSIRPQHSIDLVGPSR